MSHSTISRWIGLLLLPLLLVVGCVRGPLIRDRRVLVMNFENTIPGQESRNYAPALAEMMTASLVNQPRLAVRERQSVRFLLEGAETRPTQWQRLGRKADVDYLIVGSIARLEQNFIVSVRLLSVETGAIIKGSSSSRSCKREEDLYPLIQYLSRVLAYQVRTLAERYDRIAMGGTDFTPAPASAPPVAAPAPAPAVFNIQ